MAEPQIPGDNGFLIPNQGQSWSTKRRLKAIYRFVKPALSLRLLPKNFRRKKEPSAAAIDRASFDRASPDRPPSDRPHAIIRGGVVGNDVPSHPTVQASTGDKIMTEEGDNSGGGQEIQDNEEGCLSSGAPSTLPSAFASPNETTGPATNITTTATTPFPDDPAARDENSTTNGNPETDDFIRDAIIRTRPGATKNWLVMTLDTGADVNLIDLKFLSRFGLTMESLGDNENIVLKGFYPGSGSSVQPQGIVRGVEWYFAREPKTYIADFYVLPNMDNDAILGKKTLDEYKIVTFGSNPRQGEVRTGKRKTW